MTVGEKMAEMFSWTGKTHQQVSAATGIPRSTISSYTSGQSKVPLDAAYADAVYRLYRAGVLTGSDSLGTFGPDSSITRGAADHGYARPYAQPA